MVHLTTHWKLKQGEARQARCSSFFLENVKILKYVEPSLDHLRYFGQKWQDSNKSKKIIWRLICSWKLWSWSIATFSGGQSPCGEMAAWTIRRLRVWRPSEVNGRQVLLIRLCFLFIWWTWKEWGRCGAGADYNADGGAPHLEQGRHWQESRSREKNRE